MTRTGLDIRYAKLIYTPKLLKLMKAKISVSYRSVQLFRILLSGIFLVASFNHILNLEKTLNRIDQARFKGIAYFGNPEYLVIISGIVMMIAGFFS